MSSPETSLLFASRLLPVDDAHLIARYNAALEGFGLEQVSLQAFSIDMCGWSPEVAEALGDAQYLDPHGINRRFIILSPEQVELPVAHTAFSNTGALMHEFFGANRREISAITVKDVLYGEIDDPILKAKDIEDLLAIEQVEFKVFTGEDLSGKAMQLRTRIDRLRKEPEAWRDNALLAEMVTLAKETGDIRTNALVPKETIFRHPTFWSSHFGGVYVFLDPKETTVIGDPRAPGFRKSRPWQVSYIDEADTDRVYDFLLQTGRVEAPRGAWLEQSGWLDHRMRMALTVLAYRADPDGKHRPDDPRWAKRWITQHAALVEEEGTLPFLAWAKRELEGWSQFDLGAIDARGRMILSRAMPGHPDQWLVNRLIADYVPFDFLSRYIFNREAFRHDLERWDEGLRDHARKVIEADYLENKAALRRRLYAMDGA